MSQQSTARIEAAVAVEGRAAAGILAGAPPELLAVISIVLGAAGQLVVKGGLLLLASAGGHGLGAARITEPALTVLLGLAVYGSGICFWLRAVARARISYLYPLSALGYGVVALGGRYLFHESIQAGRWMGIGVITLGVAMLTLSEKRGEP